MGTCQLAHSTRLAYTSEDDAGWGSTPSWSGSACCTSASPLTREDLTLNSGCSVNYAASAPVAGVAVTVAADECLDPQDVLDPDTAAFIWTANLETDNQVLFFHRRAADDNSNMGPNAASSLGGITAMLLALVASIASAMLVQGYAQ